MAEFYVPDPANYAQPADSDWARMGAAELRALKRLVGGQWIPKRVTTNAFTVTADEIGQLIRMDIGGTITIPAGLRAGLFGVTGLQATSIVGAEGVTILCPPSLRPVLYEDNAFAVTMQVATDVWLVSGNLMFA